LGFAIHDFELVLAFGGEIHDVSAEALAVGSAFAVDGGEGLGGLRCLVFAGTFLKGGDHGFEAFHTEEKLEPAGEFLRIVGQRFGFIGDGTRLLPARLQLIDERVAGAFGDPRMGVKLIEDRQEALGVGADFLEYDGHIPGRLEAGSGRCRGLRLGVCRDGAEKDNQPHYFNLSCAPDERRKTRPAKCML
jgi:hypothetical protein